MGHRQNCAKCQENLFRSNETISIFCPPFFRKRPISEIRYRIEEYNKRYVLVPADKAANNVVVV